MVEGGCIEPFRDAGERNFPLLFTMFLGLASMRMNSGPRRRLQTEQTTGRNASWNPLHGAVDLAP